jgi:8-oxo-dGTP diphosphatase
VADSGIRVRVAAAVCEGDRLLLVQHEKRGARYWLLPGGGVEKGETLVAAAARELEEETGYTAEIGRLFLMAEAIEPGGRHIINMFFAAHKTGGELVLGNDSALCDAQWHSRESVIRLTLYPPVRDELVASWDENFQGPVRILGNVWRPAEPIED